MNKLETMETLVKLKLTLIDSLAKNLSIMDSTMLRNTPIMAKESLSKAIEEIGMIKNKCQAIEEERKILAEHFAECDGKTKIMHNKEDLMQTNCNNEHKTPRQDKKRKADFPPLDTSRRNKKENTVEVEEDGGPGEWLVPKEHRKKEKRKEKGRGPKTNGPVNQAIKVSAKEGTTYSEIIKKMKETVDPIAHGANILTIRRTQKKELLLVLDKKSDVSKLNEALTKAVGAQAKVNTLTRKEIVEVRDIDETVAVEEVFEAIAGRLNISKDQLTSSCRLRKGYGGMQSATILLPTQQAQQLLALEKIKIGWINCRIRQLRQVTKCYRCLDFGHISTSCRGPDRSHLCYRCGKGGHVAKECKGKIQCILCKEKNLSEDHLLGSNRCTSYSSVLSKFKKT